MKVEETVRETINHVVVHRTHLHVFDVAREVEQGLGQADAGASRAHADSVAVFVVRGLERVLALRGMRVGASLNATFVVDFGGDHRLRVWGLLGVRIVYRADFRLPIFSAIISSLERSQDHEIPVRTHCQ